MTFLLSENSEIDFWNFKIYCSKSNEVINKCNFDNDFGKEIGTFYSQIPSFKDPLRENIPMNYKNVSMQEKNIFILKIIAKMSSVYTSNSLEDHEELLNNEGFRNWLTKMNLSDCPKQYLEAWKILHNLNAHNGRKYLDGIYIYAPFQTSIHENPVADVILVHGVMGGAAWTWRQNDSMSKLPILNQKIRSNILKNPNDIESQVVQSTYSWMWPLDWLKPRLKKSIRILALDYPSQWSNWSQDIGQHKSVDELCEEFISKLKVAGVGSRPIIWISHSLGGIIVKKMLKADSNTSSSGSLLSATKGVLFLSVPHFGSPLASLSCFLSPFLRPSTYIYQLRADLPELIDLNESFRDCCLKHSIHVLTLNENQPSNITKNGPQKIFVPHDYGDPSIGDYHAVDATHLETCKPKSINDALYRHIEDFVASIIKKL